MKVLKTTLYVYLFFVQIALGNPIDYRVSGVVIDTNQTPIEFATVVLKTCDSLYVMATITDSLGHFSLTVSPDLSCGILEFNHISYQSHSKMFNLPYSEAIITVLHFDNFLLNEVVIRGNWIFRRDGNIIVDVTQLPGSETMQADNILQHLPGVMRGIDGNYELNGKRATIYINGVRQNITPESLAAYLTSLPALMLSEVELVTTNTGRFDADIEAVIDIRTRRNMPDGDMHQFAFNYGLYDRKLDNTGGSYFYMVKKGRVLFHSLLNYDNVNNFAKTSDSTRYSGGNTIINQGQNGGRYHRFTHQSNLTYDFRSNHRIDLTTFVYYDFGQYHSIWNTKMIENNDVLRNYDFRRISGVNDMWAGTLSYTSPRANEKFRVNISYSGMYGGLRSNNNHYRQNEQVPHLKSELDMTGQMHTLTANGESIFNRFRFQYGIKGDLNSMNDFVDYKDAPSSTTTFTNSFKGREIISAMHSSVRYSITDQLNAQVGFRFENTDYRLSQLSIGSTETKNYINIFPNLQFAFISQNYTSTIGLISGLNRPNYHWLIPGIRLVNEHFYTVGNPKLMPTTHYSFVFNNTLFGYLNLNFRYSQFNNVSGEIFGTDDQEMMYMTYLNYANVDNYSIHLTLPYRFLNGKIYGQLLGNSTYIKLTDFLEDFIIPTGRDTQYWRHSFQFNFQYNITERLHTNALMQYTPKSYSLLSTTQSTGNVNIGAAYSLLRNKNLILGIDINNIFASSDLVQDIFFLDNYRHQWRLRKGPVFLFSARWRLNRGQKVVDEYRSLLPDFSRMVDN